MPTIKEYQPSVRPAGPGQVQNIPLSYADAAAAPGRVAASVLSDTAAGINALGERIDRSNVILNNAKIRADMTAEMHAAVQAGEAATPDFEQTFTQRIADRQAKDNPKYYTGYGARLAAESSAGLTSELRIQAQHYQAIAIGQQAALAHSQAMEHDLNTVQTDPIQLAVVLKAYRDRIADPAGDFKGMSAQDRAKLMQEADGKFGVASLRGIIRNSDPTIAVKMLKDNTGPAALLTAAQRTHMEGEADRGVRDREIEIERRQAAQDRRERKAQEVVMRDFVAQLSDPDGPTLSIPMITGNKLLTATQQEHFIRLVNQGFGQSNPNLVMDIAGRINRGEITDMTQITQHYGKGVDKSDVAFLEREFKTGPVGQEQTNAIAVAMHYFQNTAGGDAAAGFAALEWRRAFSAEWTKLTAAGEDPTVLIRDFPGNKKFMLAPDLLDAHRVSFMQQSDALARNQRHQDAAEQAQALALFEKGEGDFPKVVPRSPEWDALPPGAFVIDPATGLLLRKPTAGPQPKKKPPPAPSALEKASAWWLGVKVPQ